MQEQNVNFTEQELSLIMEAAMHGVPLGEIVGVSSDALEAIYGIAYNLYVNQNFKDALALFEALCLYKHNDYRFIMGLAACKQALEDFQGALDAYGLATLVSGLENPEPFYHSVFCLLKLGQAEGAIEMLEAIAAIGEEGNAEHDGFKAKAADLLQQLKSE